MKRKLAQISGGVLGYIHNNWKGAGAGYKAGGYLYDKFSKKVYKNSSNMPPIPYKKRRFGYSTMQRHVQRKIRLGRTGIRSVKRNAGPNIQQVQKRKISKPVKSKRRKLRKVSKAFREKVEAAQAGTKPIGNFHEVKYGIVETDVEANTTLYGGGSLLGGGADYGVNQQFVFSSVKGTGVNAQDGFFDMFSFSQITDAISVLFFNKIQRMGTTAAPVQNYVNRDYFVWGENIYDGVLEGEFKILDMQVKWNLKNNSKRRIILKKYTCTPKKALTNSTKPFDCWNNGLTIDCQPTAAITVGMRPAMNIAGANIVAGPTLMTQTTGSNVNTLGSTPGNNKLFSANWKASQELVILEPGQLFEYTVKGPKNISFQAKKWKSESNNTVDSLTYYDYKPGFSQCQMYIIVPELLPDGGVGAARACDTSGGNDPDYGLAIERVNMYKIEANQSVGGQLSTKLPSASGAGTNYFVCNNAKNVYYRQSWINGSVATPQRIDPQNPAVSMSDQL